MRLEPGDILEIEPEAHGFARGRGNAEVGVLLEDVRLAAVLGAQPGAGEWFTRVS